MQTAGTRCKREKGGGTDKSMWHSRIFVPCLPLTQPASLQLLGRIISKLELEKEAADAERRDLVFAGEARMKQEIEAAKMTTLRDEHTQVKSLTVILPIHIHSKLHSFCTSNAIEFVSFAES